MTWIEAEAVCQTDGGHLTYVQSKDHLVWLAELVDNSKFWIGQFSCLYFDCFGLTRILLTHLIIVYILVEFNSSDFHGEGFAVFGHC